MTTRISKLTHRSLLVPDQLHLGASHSGCHKCQAQARALRPKHGGTGINHGRPATKSTGTIASALWGLAFWAILATAGAELFGTIEGVALWRLFFIVGYAGYLQGLAVRPKEKEATR